MNTEIKQTQDHRRVFVNTLNELAETDPNIILVTCDVGFNYLENTKFRTLNLGVTEYSSCVISATLALSGLSVWFYSMVPFVTFRVHEQVRNAVCCHKANVKILGVLGGPSYKMLGPSHNLLYPTEDIDMMKTMSDMQIYLPVSNDDVVNMVKDAYSHDKPSYIRL